MLRFSGVKYVFCGLLTLAATLSVAQTAPFTTRALRLPPELADHHNQFSSLYIHKAQLWLMSESRLQDKAAAKLYAIPLADINRQLTDSTHVLPYRKYALLGLEALRSQINAAGETYEGLEAMTLAGGHAYFTVETTTASRNGYVLHGRLTDTAVVLDPMLAATLPKPTLPDGTHIYNAGFEALLARGKHLYAFFEYNSFSAGNFVYRLHRRKPGTSPVLVPLRKLPFRLTDITATPRRRHFTVINYFYNGKDDSIYRLPDTDAENQLIQSGGEYRSYCRLLDLKRTGAGFTWKPLFEFPAQYRGYNWEGIAAYQGGYFILNDTYTPKKPFSSVLLYIQKSR